MKRIYKYYIAITDEQEVVLPVGAKILSVGRAADNARNSLSIWAIVDDAEMDTKTRCVLVHGTGHPANDVGDAYDFLGTVIDDMLVWHVFVGRADR